MTNPGNILHAERDGIHYLRLVGTIRYPLAPSLDKFLKNIFTDSTPCAFLVDLSATEVIDSTNLGLLVKIARLMAERHAPAVVLFSPREDITEILISMGFDQFFQLVTDKSMYGGNVVSCTPISISESEPADLSLTLLDAHRALMEMDARNEVIFRDVVYCLEQDAKSKDKFKG